MLGKVILWISTLAFVSYGLMCLFDPNVPAGFAGLTIASGDGYAELGAMYGGLQSGVGVFLLLAAWRDRDQPAALFLLFLGIGLLATLRAVGALTTSDAVSGYTWGALAFETFVACMALFLLRRSGPA